jgi:hypothetical protein
MLLNGYQGKRRWEEAGVHNLLLSIPIIPLVAPESVSSACVSLYLELMKAQILMFFLCSQDSACSAAVCIHEPGRYHSFLPYLAIFCNLVDSNQKNRLHNHFFYILLF